MGNEIHHRKDPEEPQTASNAPAADLGGLLGSILGGITEGNAPQNNPAPAAHNSPQGSDQVLGSLSGGGAGNAPMMGQGGASQPAPNMGGDLGGLFGSILGGGGAQGGTAGGDLGGLLGSLLGGAGAGTSANTGAQGADPIGGLLGGLLGSVMGGTSGSANIGGVAGMGNMNVLLTPLADALADKLGIRRDVALSAMTILVPMLLNKLASSGQQSGGDPLGNLQKSVQSGQGLNFTKSEHDNMVSQLVEQTGLSHHEASQTLSSAIQVLGGQ